MLINILILIASLIPSVLILVWMYRRKKDDALYRKSCNSALIRGLVSVAPILLLSGVLFFLTGFLRISVLGTVDVLVYKALYTFIVLAFAEELIKYLAFRFLLKKKFHADSWADVVAYMVIIGTAFGLMEDLPYAIDASPIMMLVRGFTMGHVGYAFLMGRFYGKRLATGKKRYGVLAFGIPFFLHGLYDFSLTPELIERNEAFAVIGVLLAVTDLVLIGLMIAFFVRAKKQERYSEPLTAIE